MIPYLTPMYSPLLPFTPLYPIIPFVPGGPLTPLGPRGPLWPFGPLCPWWPTDEKFVKSINNNNISQDSNGINRQLMETKDRQFDNFVVIGGTVSWRQSFQIEDLLFQLCFLEPLRDDTP